MEENKKQVVIPYANLRANTDKQYKQLVAENPYFVPATYEETEDGLTFTFDLEGLYPWKDVRKESPLTRYSLLLKACEIADLAKDYEMKIRPNNLYFTLTGEVKVLVRDIADEEADAEELFFRQFQALSGYTFQKKYGFDDYYEGGLSLLAKNKATEGFGAWTTIKEAKKYLTEKTEKTHETVLTKQKLMPKTSIRNMKIALSILGVCTVAGIALVLTYLFYVAPYNRATQNAFCSYIDGDYVSLIDHMEPVSLGRMNLHQKRMLAESYINSENLSPEQKENILLTMNANRNEKVYDYWIYVGRLEAVEAQNIAMQLSDEEMLVYAYLLERSLLEKNTKMDGEEKRTKIAELDKKIEQYTDQMEDEELEGEEQKIPLRL